MRQRIHRGLLVPGTAAAAFWVLGISLWRATGLVQLLALFGYIGTAVGVGLAFALSDNRAFCRYLCPVTVFLTVRAKDALRVSWGLDLGGSERLREREAVPPTA